MITFALPKGRLAEQVVAALGEWGPAPAELAGRALVVPSRNGRVRHLLLKPADVPAYVERGVADAGVVGLDVLREGTADVLEPLALPLGRCRLCLCGRPGTDLAARAREGRLVIATKYPRLAGETLARRGLVAELVPLHGSVELAVVVGLADAVVDLVETGGTLRANGLDVLDELLPVSARLVVNRAAAVLRAADLAPLVDRLETGCAAST